MFPHLSVKDNLWAQIRFSVDGSARRDALDRAFEMFPMLAERRRQQAGTLSGGEQQMLSLARVLAAPPKLLIADEMSLGLAPLLVDLVFESLERAKRRRHRAAHRAVRGARAGLRRRRGDPPPRAGGLARRGEAAGNELLAEYLGGETASTLPFFPG